MSKYFQGQILAIPVEVEVELGPALQGGWMGGYFKFTSCRFAFPVAWWAYMKHDLYMEKPF